MLASDTQEIADYLKSVIVDHYQLEAAQTQERFADTRDTLCYATNDNQGAVRGLLEESADLAIVVGGYNSSNTSHLVELCEEKLPTYYIENENNLIDDLTIHHFNFHEHVELISTDYLPKKEKVKILITSGASCPDAVVENVIRKILSYFQTDKTIEHMIEEIKK
jgi:4-hydroxy-3-methylbut-2-enyl diphosphate reductase